MNEQKRILVVEDNKIHQESAKELLGGYDLKIVDNFEELNKALLGTYWDDGVSYYEHGRKVIGEEKLNWEFPKEPNFDVVLSDLNFPMERFGKEAPLGYMVALRCAMASIPHCAIYTDTDHHGGPIARTFDYLKEHLPEHKWKPARFQINGTNVMLFDSDSFHTRNKPKKWDEALDSLLTNK